MKNRLSLLSLAQLFAVAGLAASALCPTAEAAMMHSDIDQRTYTNFAQNLGRYKATGVSTLLQAIREKDGGIVLVDKNGNKTGTISLGQGMINFSGVEDMPGWFHGAGAALGNNFIVTAEHNSVFNASFGVSELGSSHAIAYQTIRESAGRGDFALYRQNKIFTDVVGASMYSGVESDTEISGILGETIYRAGGGVHWKFTDYSGSKEHVAKAYTFLAGGMGTISGASFGGYENTDTYRISWGMDISGGGVNEANPIPITTNGGDSGSPIYIYNEATGKYEYLFALTGDTRHDWSIGSGAIKWTADAMAEFNREVDMSSATTATIGAVSAATADKAATGTVSVNGATVEFLGVASGTHTWKDLSPEKDKANWYAYGNGYQNGISGLGNTSNLVFKGSGLETNHTITLNATVDLGIGYTEFSNGKFTIASANGGNYTLNSAGYVINKGAEVHLKLTNDADYMREWRKNGEGDLYIEGNGDNNVLLAVGGSGKTYLQRENGYAAYNVLASSGATVVIKDTKQIARDFTFGLSGGTLDMNGNSMDWYTTNTDVAADGFSINALTDEAVITNTGTQATTLTYKQGGATTFKGSFWDTDSGAIKIVADAGADSVWTLNGIVTDLSKNNASGFEVKSGKVVLAGTNTVHGTGSVDLSEDVFFSEDDWHYADAQMNVTLQSGTTLELGSHVRLKGDVTVDGGAYIMREGVRHQMEYIEGGLIKEDTYAWSNYYGHHGNTTLNNGTMKVEFSAGTTANTTYAGNITGTGTLSVDAADGSLTLTGNNTFAGERSLVGGTLIVEDAAAAGNTKWKVGDKGVFAAQNTDGNTALNYIDASASGVLALTQNQTTQVDVSGHKNLIVGALAGKEIQYGTQGTSETLTARDNVWRLGGGGGNLVVNYHLTGANKLVLGNAHTKGVVTLTNEKNNFTGGIDFMGSGVTLEYSSEAAIKNITLNLRYGNRTAMTGLLGNVTKASDGILLQCNASQDLDLSAHQNLSFGANSNLDYTGKITIADNQAYRFSAAAGTLTVNSEIGGAHDIVVDAQTYSGGTVKLNKLNNFTGALTVAGYDATKTSNRTGSITLEVTQDNVLDRAGTVTLKAGGTLHIGDTTQKITNLVLDAGATLYGNRLESTTDTKASELHVTIDNLSKFQGSINVATIHRYGESTLELNGSSNFRCASLILEEGDAKLTGTVFGTIGGLDLKNHTLYLNGQYLYSAVVMEDGGKIDASVAGSAFSGYSRVVGNSGTSVIDNGGNNVSLSGNLVAVEGATVRLEGSGSWTFSADGYNNSSGYFVEGTIQVEAPTLMFKNKADNLTLVAVGGTLELLSAAGSKEVTIDFSGEDNSALKELRFSKLLITDKNLTLEENTKKNATFTIGTLSGSGTVTWNADLNTSTDGTANASRLVFNGEGDFSGTVTAKRTANGLAYNTFVELAHDKALQNATLDLQGMSGGNVALAINTDNARIQGLCGNEHAVVYGGAASATAVDSVTSDKAATLTIAGSGTYDYKGAVAGVSIAMNGTGTQTFSGTSVVVNDISALAGTLDFTQAPTLKGNISVAQGATLKLGNSFSLDAGHTLSVLAGTDKSGKATLTSALVLNGGTLGFDGAALNESSSLLSATTSFGTAFSTQGVSFSNESLLEIGKTYKLLDGNWSGKTATLADSMPDYLKASTFKADANGLSVTLALANGFAEWKNAYQVFESGKTVLFRDADFDKSLNFSAATEAAGARFVNGESYTFNGNDVNLSGELVMTSGKLTLNNKLSAASYVSGDGEIEIGETGTLAITETQSGEVAVNNISGAGTLSVKFTSADDYANTLTVDTDFAGTTHIQSGNFNLGESNYGNTLKLANGVNAGINAETTIAGNLVLEGVSQIDQTGKHLAVDGRVSGNGTWDRQGGGTLDFNAAVNLAGFDTASSGTITHFNADSSVDTVTVDQSNTTLGGTGTLSTNNFNLAAGSSVTIDGLDVVETTSQTREWTRNSTTTVNLKNGAVLDTQLSDYGVSGVMNVGGSDADGTLYVNGVRLSTVSSEAYDGVLNVHAGAHLVIVGESSGTGNGDFVLAHYGEAHYFSGKNGKINVDGLLTSNAAMTLMHNNAYLNVNDGGTLNLLKGLKLTGACKTNYMDNVVNATLNVNEGARLNAAGGEQHNNLFVTFAGNTTLGAIGNADETVTFSNNMTIGTANATGTFTIDTSANTADVDFNLSSDAMAGAIVDLTGTLAWQGTTALEVVGNGTLKHKNAFNNASDIRVQKDATLAVDSSAALTRATELNEGALALASGASVSADLSIHASGTVRATGNASLTGTMHLNDGASVAYDVASGATLNASAALAYSGERGVLTKAGAGTLAINDSAGALATIRAETGTLKVHGVENYRLNELTLGEQSVVGFFKNAVGSETAEANIYITDKAQFSAGAHLNANLILSGGSTLEVADVGLSMGSTLTLEQGVLLGDATLARAGELKVGETLTLFTGVDQLILGSGENALLINPESDWSAGADAYLSNLAANAFELYFTGSSGNGTFGILAIPEPSAFGLLAGLGALALVGTRRRRR